MAIQFHASPLRRRVVAGLLGLALLVSATTVAFRAVVPADSLDTVRPGQLSVSQQATGTWQLGPVTVTLTTERLQIEQSGTSIFSSDPGSAFITGGRGHVETAEHRGYFWPQVRLRDRLADQSVDSVTRRGQALVLTGELRGRSDDATYRLRLARMPQHGVTLDLTTRGDLDTVGLVSGRTPNAGVHGFGEQFTDFNLDKRLLPVLIREQGVGRGKQPLTLLADLTNHGAGGTEQMTYAAWSSFVTGDLRGVRLDPALSESHAFAVADTRNPDQIGLQVWAPRLRAELTGAPTPSTLVIRQQHRRGQASPQLTRWTQGGAIVGLQGGTAAVRRKVATLRDAGAEISAVWLQDWTGQRTTDFGERLWWTWQLDQERYPGWSELVAELGREGIRTTTYVNPFLVDAAPKHDSKIRNLWQEAHDAGYLVRAPDGSPYRLDQGGFDASLVDLTNPQAQEWFARVIANEVLADGVSGFMADFGEGLPMDAVLAAGDAAQLHNQWPKLWADTVQQGCVLANKPDCVTWFRSGSVGMDSTAALFWNGDQLVDFGPDDGLASALLGTFSAGVSGWPLVHSDIGGYTSIDAKVHDYTRPADLLERWAEYAAFSVVMRTHEGNRPAANAQVYESPARAQAFARMTKVFAALAPYRRSVLARSERTGLPAIRHGWLVYPGTEAAEVDTQFFLGESILVAPVLTSGADSVRVTFPPGQWVHLLTGATYTGGRTSTVAAPIGTPAAFVKADDPQAAAVRQALQDSLD